MGRGGRRVPRGRVPRGRVAPPGRGPAHPTGVRGFRGLAVAAGVRPHRTPRPGGHGEPGAVLPSVRHPGGPEGHGGRVPVGGADHRDHRAADRPPGTVRGPRVQRPPSQAGGAPRGAGRDRPRAPYPVQSRPRPPLRRRGRSGRCGGGKAAARASVFLPGPLQWTGGPPAGQLGEGAAAGRHGPPLGDPGPGPDGRHRLCRGGPSHSRDFRRERPPGRGHRRPQLLHRGPGRHHLRDPRGRAAPRRRDSGGGGGPGGRVPRSGRCGGGRPHGLLDRRTRDRAEWDPRPRDPGGGPDQRLRADRWEQPPDRSPGRRSWRPSMGSSTTPR